ncbi:helix-turn-helix transcriptional regulator [Shewanella mesophila]|uniref:helix-turn-helix domain-containing protein n=1 Tax=Shewanella mesophila TaxID=2864208 RepID=UPI001C65CBA2|nr:helix-turn-helix transcriptional regulator [Shewanella mesophila]QYJ85842.1 helix-turn-helix transcriptional regulator [Shewanella mesophila]
MEQLTKNDTILWINHAITYFKSIGKTQKDMAKLLGIEESRLSEMKGGSGLISQNLMVKIVEYCGAPRRNPGRYEEVELYNDLQQFFDNFKSITVNRFYRKLQKLIKNDDIYSQLLDAVSPHELHYKADKETIEAMLNELFISEEFLDKCEKYSKVLLTTVGYDERPIEGFQWWNIDEAGCRILSIAGLIIKDFDSFKLLYLFSKLFSANLGFKFGSDTPLNLQPEVPSEPVILTGKCILIMKRGSLESTIINSAFFDLIGKKKIGIELNKYRGLKLKSEQYMPDYWQEVRCELYLSDNMNYHFLIYLSPTYIGESADIDDDSGNPLKWRGDVGPDDRLIIIRNVNSLSLYQKIEEIRKWFGLPDDSLFELKREIAKAGGYVPGARVLL